uniref:LOB domain-containing protein n=1 Tax=Rhizophora mucronata TaxID=61149 RepID=A0A2P2LU97_RHIMU
MSNRGLKTVCAKHRKNKKKCGENCILKPYFSAENMREFDSVTTVYSTENMERMLQASNPDQRQNVVKSMLWVSSCYKEDPRFGPHGRYNLLEEEKQKILEENKEMHGVMEELRSRVDSLEGILKQKGIENESYNEGSKRPRPSDEIETQERPNQQNPSSEIETLERNFGREQATPQNEIPVHPAAGAATDGPDVGIIERQQDPFYAREFPDSSWIGEYYR